jgi:hypothetical protein
MAEQHPSARAALEDGPPFAFFRGFPCRPLVAVGRRAGPEFIRPFVIDQQRAGPDDAETLRAAEQAASRPIRSPASIFKTTAGVCGSVVASKFVNTTSPFKSDAMIGTEAGA